jgi:thiamine kinase-like enzyme
MGQENFSLAALGVMMASSISLIGSQSEEVVSAWTMSYVKTVTCDHFGSRLENVQVSPLAGGYSDAANVKLEVAGKVYVLRVIGELESPLKRNTEIYAIKEAAAAGVAPGVYWVSPDGYGVLMDYIPGGTLTIEKGREPEIIFKVADLMRRVHALPKNPFYAPSFESVMEEFYKEYSQGDSNQDVWEGAISIIKEGEAQLQSLNAPTVNTHGDLNPRNILVSHQDVYFIDWGDGIYTDPFQDLSFFSIMMNYDSQEEAYFMECYLGHAPTMNEKKRFRIAKKMNFARLALSGQGIGNQLRSDQKATDDVLEPLREWSYYAKTFANGDKSLSAQFFWGQARVALEAAKILDANNID